MNILHTPRDSHLSQLGGICRTSYPQIADIAARAGVNLDRRKGFDARKRTKAATSDWRGERKDRGCGRNAGGRGPGSKTVATVIIRL